MMKPTNYLLFLFFSFLIVTPSPVFAIGGEGATCNPSTANWGQCPLATVPFVASVTKTVTLPGGSYPTPYTASQANTRYVLQGDITASSIGIVVAASYTIIDLNGHTITYNEINAGEGITFGAWNLTHVSIINGSIIQGTAMSEGNQYGLGNNPIGKYNTALAASRTVDFLHVANLYVRYGGRDVGGINCAGSNGLYEQNTIEDTYKFGTLKNRHQGIDALAGAKNEGNSTDNVYRNNTLINARHRGIATGNHAEAYGNNISIRSIATNAAGIWQFDGHDVTVHDNTIVGRGEHPIGVFAGGGSGSENWEIYNNSIDLQTTALGEEYGSAYLANPSAIYTSNSAAGIRITWGGNNINAYNNQITILTNSNQSGTYSPTGQTAYIDGGGKGLFIGANAGEKSTYSGNIISVIGTGSYTYGVTCSYSFSDGLFIINNSITSSQHNIVIGDDYGACNGYPLFQGNILTKSGNAQNYTTIINTYNDNDRHSQARFIDNVYQNGASESSISLRPQGAGVTDVYFGSAVNNEHRYSYRLHDNNGASSVLLREDFSPTVSLNYSYPGFTPTAPPIVPIIQNIIKK